MLPNDAVVVSFPKCHSDVNHSTGRPGYESYSKAGVPISCSMRWEREHVDLSHVRFLEMAAYPSRVLEDLSYPVYQSDIDIVVQRAIALYTQTRAFD
jgi:hypothetical protein